MALEFLLEFTDLAAFHPVPRECLHFLWFQGSLQTGSCPCIYHLEENTPVNTTEEIDVLHSLGTNESCLKGPGEKAWALANNCRPCVVFWSRPSLGRAHWMTQMVKRIQLKVKKNQALSVAAHICIYTMFGFIESFHILSFDLYQL